MVLWEITVGTAYFLGLKRTYKLALRIQRYLVPSNRPQLRGFLHRRTRAVFNVALSVHRNIQQKDLEVGRNFGNWVLHWLDRKKPSAAIRGKPTQLICQQPRAAKFIKESWQSIGTRGISSSKMIGRDLVGRMLASPLNIRLPKSAPTLAMILCPQRAVGISSNYCRLSHVCTAPSVQNWKFDGVFRIDIAQRLSHLHTAPLMQNQKFEGVFRRDIAVWMQQ